MERGKKTEFQLDGYDTEKHIGYQMVTVADKAQWEESREQGDETAPDLKDTELIQQQCLQYEFPVIFICSYSYQVEIKKEQALNIWICLEMSFIRC
jgi:hypothetical protein